MDVQIVENREYQRWLQELKSRVQAAQIKAAVQINYELLRLYWQLGLEILEKEKLSDWGDALVEQLSKDLMATFPGMKGFSRTNLFYIRKWVLFYSRDIIVPQGVGELPALPDLETSIPQLVGQIPWGHNREIITKCKTVPEALFYARETLKNNWSRSVLVGQMESGLYQRKGAAIDNFEATLPTPQADLARETLKNPYNFEFLMINQEANERELENALIEQIQKFVMEMGQGFAYMGRQYPLQVGHSEFFLDLLFYHVRLRNYIVVELKTVAFQPEFAGKLNFYLNAIDAELKHPDDNPSIGILLCKTPDKVVVEYSLKNVSGPMGVASYQLTKTLPSDLKADLSTIEAIATRLKE